MKLILVVKQCVSAASINGSNAQAKDTDKPSLHQARPYQHQEVSPKSHPHNPLSPHSPPFPGDI